MSGKQMEKNEWYDWLLSFEELEDEPGFESTVDPLNSERQGC